MLVCHTLLTTERQRRIDCYSYIHVCASPLTLLKVNQKAKFQPMSAQFVGELQAVESIREGKVQLLFISSESLLLVYAGPQLATRAVN